MKIHIYYRHYNVAGNDKNRPSWFDYESCFQNLINTLKGVDKSLYNLNIIFDGDVTKNWINLYNYKKYEIQCGSDTCSFFNTCNIINNDSNINDGDLVYLLENDYLHVNGWLNKLLELFKTYNGLDYVSLYDHNDKYFLPMYDNLVSKIITTNTHHWRTTPSTCGSFIMSSQKFKEDYDVLSTMKGDHNKFLWLNQHRNRSVITPIPGLSTHVMSGLLSPTIDWESKIK